MCSKRLERVGRLRIVIRKKKVAYTIVERVVKTSFALKGIAFAECTVFEQQSNDFVVSTETCLLQSAIESCQQPKKSDVCSMCPLC